MADAKKTVATKTTDKKTSSKDKAAKPAKSAPPKSSPELKDEIDAAAKESNPTAKQAKVAKAGKRSEKGIKQAEEKQTKIERQTKTDESNAGEKSSKPKHVQKARTKLERSSKAYRKLSEQLEPGKIYAVLEALELATKTSPVKFDATVELHIRLAVDPKQADQNIRDTISLPAGTGKTVRVAVFAEPDHVAEAKKAGADVAASDEFLQQLDKAAIDFDILIVTPPQMTKLGKYARLLGPKGLMPNPKSGTVTTDIVKAVTEAKQGRLEYRVDSTGIIHVGIGKVSFGADKLNQNAEALFKSIKNNKPSSLKGVYVNSIFVTTSMGPSIAVETSVI